MRTSLNWIHVGPLLIALVAAVLSSDAIARDPCADIEDKTLGGGIGRNPEIASIESLSIVDSPESQGALAESLRRLTDRWTGAADLLPAGTDSSLVVRAWRGEVLSATDCLTRMSQRDIDPGAVRVCLRPARNAEALLPVIESMGRGETSAVLVITSVGCECVMNACHRMSALFDDVLEATPELPLARIDEMLLPELAEGWELYQIPSWVFLGASGDIEFMLEGKDVENSEVLSELPIWMNAGRPVSDK